VISAYELYANDRYGINGVFYWYHIRFNAPSYAQTELDRVEATADGMVFSSFASCCATWVYTLAILGRGVGALLRGSRFDKWLIASSVSDGKLITFLLLSIASWIVFNRLAIFALRNLGKNMRAVIDLVVPTIVKYGAEWLPSEAQRERLRRRQQYLAFGIPLTAPRRNEPPGDGAAREPRGDRSETARGTPA
jgi:hypothetical protein